MSTNSKFNVRNLTREEPRDPPKPSRSWMFQVILATFLAAMSAPAQTFSILHKCDPDTGMFPNGLLHGPDNVFYGVAQQTALQPGMGSGPGAIFKMKADGSGYTVLKQFTYDSRGIAPEGAFPEGNLVLDGAALYGTTSASGTNGYYGTMFRMGTDGSDFRVIHDFGDSYGMFGSNPQGDLVLDGGTIWGTAFSGGNPGGQGTIFHIDTNGNMFGACHFFYGPDGRHPVALIKSGDVLYGTTADAGFDSVHWYGSIFRMSTGGGTELEHVFDGSDGMTPGEGMLLLGTNLYGTTFQGGGSNNCGTLYRVSTNFTDFVVLRRFTSADGRPIGKLAIAGQTIYGVTQGGGSSGCGIIFKVNIDGSEFTILKEFAGGTEDGDTPTDLILSGNTLYGTTMCGGNPSGYESYGSTYGAGVIFSLSLAPALTLVNPSCSGTNFTFSIQTSSNTSYTVQYNDDLSSASWRFFKTVAGDGSLLSCCVPMTNGTQRFFRVRSP